MVDWIGANLAVHPLGLEATAKADILTELAADLDALEGVNIVTKKAVRSLAGRGSHIATLVPAWRPFLAELWAALSSEPGGAPENCVWARQISATTSWMRAFIAGRVGTISRLYRLSAYMNLGTPLEIVTDASPWGIGGYLRQGDAITEFFAGPLGAEDLRRFGYAEGSSDGQQAWESLAALVALRIWARHWRQDRVRLRVRGESVTMLTALLHLKTATNSPLTLLAREMALDIADASFEPDCGSHLPGDANILADKLSRKYAPGEEAWLLPSILESATEVFPPARSPDYYRTLSPPH